MNFHESPDVLLTKVRNRMLVQLLRLPPVRRRSDRAYTEAVADHARRLPPLRPTHARLLAEIIKTGAVLTSLDELAAADAEPLLPAAQTAAQSTWSAPVNKVGFVVHAPTDEMVRTPAIYRWGLGEPLDLVERALGLPVAYHGVYLRRDIANSLVTRSRLWHQDAEDRRIIKIIVYLKDVDENSGAFEYLPRPLSARLSEAFGGRYGYYSDEQIRRVSSDDPLGAARTCVGKAGTVIIADTCGTFHRGRRPVTADRLALFYDYTSRRPLHPFYCKPAFTVAQERNLTEGMTERQKSCVFWRPERSRPRADLF